MFCRNGCYLTVPTIKLRAVPEHRSFLVFTPQNPNLYSLNPNARLVLHLCDGRAGSALEDAYCAALHPMVSKRAARNELRTTIDDLERKGIIRNVGHSSHPQQGER